MFIDLKIYLSLLLVCLLSSQAQAQVILGEHEDHYQVGRFMEYLEDPSCKLGIDDVTSLPYLYQFLRTDSTANNFGFTRSAYWIRLCIVDRSKQATEWRLQIQFTNIHDIVYYRPKADGDGFEKIHTGMLRPFAEREIPYHGFVFKLCPPRNTQYTIYLRLYGQTSMTVPLVIMSPEAFHRYSLLEMFYSGIFYGTLLVMLGYNAFLWLVLKDTGYLYYIAFIANVLMFQCSYDGFGVKYLWTDVIWWQKVSTILFLVMLPITSLAFTSEFLETRQRARYWYKFIVSFIIIWSVILLCIPFVPIDSLAKIIIPLRILNSLLLISVSFYLWYRGYRSAFYLLAAWLMAITANILITLVRANIIASSMITERGYLLGVLLTVLLQSLALADRIQILRQEKESAQTDALNALKAKEQCILEQNILLEKKVAERTWELEKYQKNLEDQVQKELAKGRQREQLLMQKSKLESLGVLAAGIAHEINQPLTRISFGADNILLKLAQNDSIDPAYLKAKSQNILAGVDRISYIIQHIRGFVCGKQNGDDVPIDVNTTIDNVLSLVQTQYRNHNISIEKNLQSKGRVMLNNYKLEQVLLNVLSNAKDAIDNKSNDSISFWEGKIVVRTYNESQQIVIEISDNGIGIPAPAIEQIFDPFFTTKAVGQGIGLGLFISYNIIKDAQGEILAESQHNIGTTFKILLPFLDYSKDSNNAIANFNLR